MRKAIDAAGHPALLFVDGVSSIGSLPFKADEWKVDAAIAGSQKGLMLPAGLGVACISPKGLQAAESQAGKNDRLAKVYFDFADQMKANPPATSPTRRRCRCSTACARPWPACSRRGLENVYRPPSRPRRGDARRRGRPGASRRAPRSRSGIPTPSRAIVVPEGVNAAE